MNDPRHAEGKRAAQAEHDRVIGAFNRWTKAHPSMEMEVVDWAIREGREPDNPISVGVVHTYALGYAAGLIDGHNEAMNGHKCE